MIPIETLEDLALQAGAAIMSIYRSGQLDVQTKDDRSPVTQADLLANDIICRGLKQISALPIVSEEGSDQPWLGTDEPSSYWLIDPIDGTKEFIAHRPTFTVNIALIERGVPVTGVVYAPEREELYSGSTAGFRLNQKVVKPVWGSEPIAVSSASHREKQFDDFLRTNGITTVIPMGSSIKFCLVAKGEAHYYPRYSPLSAWDTAAGDAVARAAGCRMSDISNGESLAYAYHRRWNPGFILEAPGCVARLNHRQ